MKVDAVPSGARRDKAAESAALRAFAAAQEPDSYIAGLLTPDLLDWFEQQIKGDLWPDLCRSLAVAEQRRQYAEERAQARAAQLEEKGLGLVTANNLLADLAEQLARLEQDRDFLLARLTEKDAAIVALTTLAEAQQNETFRERIRRENAEKLIADLRAELRDVKCEAFDALRAAGAFRAGGPRES